VDQHRSGWRFIQADHVLEQAGFATAGTAQNHEDLPALHRKIEILQDNVGAIAHRQVAHLDDVIGGRLRH